MNCSQCAARHEHLSNTDPTHLIPSLCEQFYHLGWVTGTGGSISIRERHNEKTGQDLVYITPSGVHKERILSNDLYCTTASDESNIISCPAPELGYRMSQCTPLFYNAYQLRDAGAVIHTHSVNAVMATMLFEQKGIHEFRITHQEMIKGIKIGNGPAYHKYFDTLVVPIIENTPNERDLKASMQQAMEKYPHTNAVLVRRHGIYVWGSSWQEAKSMCECYDYLLGVAVEMMKGGMDPAAVPAASPYKDEMQVFGPLE